MVSPAPKNIHITDFENPYFSEDEGKRAARQCVDFVPENDDPREMWHDLRDLLIMLGIIEPVERPTRLCRTCGEVKDRKNEFRQDRTKGRYYSADCKPCVRSTENEKRRQRVASGRL